MNQIRLATQAEVEQIADVTDLGPGCSVLALDSVDGSGTSYAVARQLWELDPVIFAPGASDRAKLMFLWGLENRMAGAGIGFYYFNTAASDTVWQDNLKGLGAQCISRGPELRFKKVI